MGFSKVEGIANRFLEQNQDLAFSYSGSAGDFVVVGFTAIESINNPFEIRIDLASPDPSIDLHALIDSEGVLGVYDKYDTPRFFHGNVAQIKRGKSGTRRTFYSVVLNPVLSRLQHSSDSRIWQGKNVPDIVSAVLKQYNIPNVVWHLERQYQPREFICQYRETHLEFIERILSEEGIFYFFEQYIDAHKLIITDSVSTCPVLGSENTITYNPLSGGQSRNSWVSSFEQVERVRPSAYVLNDYTFHNPPANMSQRRTMQEDNGLSGEYELYDYPGRYKDPMAIGGSFTQNRIESVRVDATTADGVTNNIHLSAGFYFELIGLGNDSANGPYRVLSVEHTGRQAIALEEDAGTSPTTFSAEFTCQPWHLQYRPPVPRKPLVDGPQIAIVTGPPNEEIFCDEHGRVKIWFPWDRHGSQDETSSCWIRVSQSWAGGNMGSFALPRIGHEVIVDYLDGDIDQPIIIGRTHHASNRTAYSLPEHKTKMAIRSASHRGEGFNEFSFEDEAGREEILLKATKDIVELVPSRKTAVVGGSVVGSINALNGYIPLLNLLPSGTSGIDDVLENMLRANEDESKRRM